jgi:hypothetical protein
MNPTDAIPSDFRSLSPRGFLGFPHTRPDTPIALDGDIVLLTGANGAGKSSLLEAIALRESGGTHRDDIEQFIYRGSGSDGRFTLRFDTNEIQGDTEDLVDLPSHPHPAWWKPEPANRRRHAQTVYFHPAYLRELFEETPVTPGTGFLDLLAPAPSAVDKLRIALKSTEPSIAAEIAKLERESGVLSPKEINDTRRQHVAAFNTRAAVWLPGYSADRLVINSGNLRSTWSGELANIAREAISRLGERGQSLGVSEASTPAESLRTLAIATRLSASAPEKSESASAATSATPPPSTLAEIGRIEISDWPVFRDFLLCRKVALIETRKIELPALREKRDAIRRLRNAFGRGEDDFPAWIVDFQRRALLGRDLMQLHQPAVPPPENLAQWGDDAIHLATRWKDVESAWNGWATRLDDEEKAHSHQLATQEADAAKLIRFQEIADTLRPWLDERPELEPVIASLHEPSEFLKLAAPSDPVVTQTNLSAPTSGEAFAQACETWLGWEREVEESEIRQTTPEFIARGKNLARLRELHSAIKTEFGSSSKSRLGQLQQDALGESLTPLESFLNQTADQFRLFDTIKPIRLERNDNTKTGNRLALRVGDPPREISQCSSGQRSQLGLLLFLALHYGLRDTYRSRVLCIDEVTSSFDLAQVPRLALLLRQIAYAPRGSAFQRRIFIASHNEAFSQRLAEMLTPPNGRSLRVLRFTGYDPASGPTIDSLLLQDAAALRGGDLETYLRHRHGPAAHA